MDIRLVGDVAAESGAGPIIYGWSGPTRKHFLLRDFGPGLVGLGLVLVCQDSSLNLKRRIRFARKEKMLYIDIMLDLDQMRSANEEVRKQIVARQLSQEVPEVVSKYSIPDFDQVCFFEEFKKWIEEIAKASTNPAAGAYDATKH
jgi:hypothetical protein